MIAKIFWANQRDILSFEQLLVFFWIVFGFCACFRTHLCTHSYRFSIWVAVSQCERTQLQLDVEFMYINSPKKKIEPIFLSEWYHLFLKTSIRLKVRNSPQAERKKNETLTYLRFVCLVAAFIDHNFLWGEITHIRALFIFVVAIAAVVLIIPKINHSKCRKLKQTIRQKKNHMNERNIHWQIFANVEFISVVCCCCFVFVLCCCSVLLVNLWLS